MITKKRTFFLTHPVRVTLIILVTAISVFPFLWMFSNSFMSKKYILAVPPRFLPDLLFTGKMFDNYVQVITYNNFGRYTWNSLWVCLLAGVGQVFICSLSGFALAKMRFRGRNVLFSFLMMTLLIPVQVTIIPEYYLMLKLTWLNTYLPLIIPSFLAGALGTFMLKEFFEQVPQALFDAAVIDGVSAWQMYVRICFPLCTAPASTLFIIAFMNNWNDLLRPMLYLSDKKLYTVTLALSQFQNQYEIEWNLLLAGSVLSVIPLFVLFIFCQRYIIESTMQTGIKG